MKQSILIVLTYAFSLLLVACSTADVGKNQETNDGKNQENNQMTVKKDALTVGTGLTGPPNSYVDENTQEQKGLYVDIVNEIGERLDYTVEIVPTKFSSLIPALKSDKIDIIAEAMYATDERKQEINFTDYVSRFGEGLIVHEDTDSISNMEDLKDKKIGVQIGTTYLDMVEERGITDRKSVV